MRMVMAEDLLWEGAQKKKGHLFFTCPLSIEPTLFNMFLTCHVMDCNVCFLEKGQRFPFRFREQV